MWGLPFWKWGLQQAPQPALPGLGFCGCLCNTARTKVGSRNCRTSNRDRIPEAALLDRANKPNLTWFMGVKCSDGCLCGTWNNGRSPY